VLGEGGGEKAGRIKKKSRNNHSGPQYPVEVKTCAVPLEKKEEGITRQEALPFGGEKKKGQGPVKKVLSR